MKHLILILISFAILSANAQDSINDSTQYNEVKSIVSFYKYMLNTVGDAKTSTRDKEVIINESYKKAFIDSKVQVEDDLIKDRNVITNKDVGAYLRDVDFFFKEIEFSFDNINIEKIKKGEDSFFYQVAFESTIKGITIENDTLTSTKKRFIEINFNQKNNDLKIASIYSTKMSRTKELQNWWSTLSYGWVNIFNEYVKYDSITADILLQIASIDSLDISGNQFVQNIEPLSVLKDLKSINLSNTKIDDLSPLRYSRDLKKINASNSLVRNISSLQYFENLRELNLTSSEVTDISVLGRLKKLVVLHLSYTKITDFSSISKLKFIQSVDLSNTSFSNTQLFNQNIALEELNLSRSLITNLAPIKANKNIRSLNISETNIVDLSALEEHPSLEVLTINRTPIGSLQPLQNTPSLVKIYADETLISEQEASSFMAENPKVIVIANSEQVMQWWNSLPINWKSIFSSILGISKPQKEDIIKLLNKDSLNIAGKNLYKIEPLKRFKRLKYLDVSNNLFTNFEFTEYMTDLTFLNAERLPIESTNGLNKNRNLRSLILKESLLKDIDSLIYLNKLELLDADKTDLTTAQVAKYLQTNSKTVVIYRSEDLKSWWNELSENWKKVWNLKEVNEYALHELIQGSEISISELPISSLQPLSIFLNLKKISLNKVAINNIKELLIHKNLTHLGCTNSPLQSIEGITNFRRLESLDISNTAIENLKELDGMISLKNLKCSGLQIKNLKGVNELYQLESIDFSNTRVWKLQRLYGMNSLNKLVCNNTRLRDHTIEEFREAFPNCEIVFY